MIPVSAKRLRYRPCQLCDTFVKAVQLFPLFDRRGDVHYVMVLPDDPGTICLAPWRPGQWRVPLWGTIYFNGDRNAWRDLSRYSLPNMTEMWHYDPWWVLNAASYTRHRDRPRLMETNCPEHLEIKIPALYYRRDLSRIGLALCVKRGSAQWRGWSEDWLPSSRPIRGETAAPAGARHAVPRWVLDPAWAPRVTRATRSALQRHEPAW